jgi:flagellar P-ring protein precursor FlgI
MLQQMGVTLPPGQPMQPRNVAAVMVTASCRLRPAGPAHRRGRRVDGQRQEPARRHADRHAAQGRRRPDLRLAQGNLIVGGAGASAGGSKVQINHLSAGRIPDGATVERAVPTR